MQTQLAERRPIAIRKLWPSERELLSDHLLRLGPNDRRMRFCGATKDEFIERYCQRIDWQKATIIGYFDDGVLRGAAELAPTEDTWQRKAELALTVERRYQNRGIGTELLRMALVMARNRFIQTVYMICLLDNVKMQRVATKCDAQLITHPGEVEGQISPPWPSALSLVEEAMAEGHALFRAAFDLAMPVRSKGSGPDFS